MPVIFIFYVFSHISDTFIAFLQLMFSHFYCVFFAVPLEMMDKGFTAHMELSKRALA
jgi:hypothetical protein